MRWPCRSLSMWTSTCIDRSGNTKRRGRNRLLLFCCSFCAPCSRLSAKARISDRIHSKRASEVEARAASIELMQEQERPCRPNAFPQPLKPDSCCNWLDLCYPRSPNARDLGHPNQEAELLSQVPKCEGPGAPTPRGGITITVRAIEDLRNTRIPLKNSNRWLMLPRRGRSQLRMRLRSIAFRKEPYCFRAELPARTAAGGGPACWGNTLCACGRSSCHASAPPPRHERL